MVAADRRAQLRVLDRDIVRDEHVVEVQYLRYEAVADRPGADKSVPTFCGCVAEPSLE